MLMKLQSARDESLARTVTLFFHEERPEHLSSQNICANNITNRGISLEPLKLRRLTASLRHHGDYLIYVHVQLDYPATNRYNSSYPWTIRWNERATDCDRVWFTPHPSQT
jgi:hypothetical protein